MPPKTGLTELVRRTLGDDLTRSLREPGRSLATTATRSFTSAAVIWIAPFGVGEGRQRSERRGATVL